MSYELNSKINYFEILCIDPSDLNMLPDEEAKSKFIKKAYTKMLRKYPPDRYPEEFKLIRQAYEVLYDSKTRREYEITVEMEEKGYKEKVDEHLLHAQQAMNAQDFKKAIMEYKKALVIAPELTYIRNLLGLAFLCDNQYDAAVNQFEKLVSESKENSTYQTNLGIAYFKSEQYDKAEKALKTALALDPQNSSAILQIARLYYRMNNMDKSIQILRKAIHYDGVVDFEDFIYFFEMVEMYIYSNNIDEAEKVIDEIEAELLEDPESVKYIAWKFANLAYNLYEIKAYRLAKKIAERSLMMDPENENIEKLLNASENLDRLYSMMDKLLNDDDILPPLKGPLYYYFYGDNIEENKYKASVQKNIDAIESYIKYSAAEVVKSINILKERYYSLYECKKDIFDEIFKIAQKNKKRDEQWLQLKDDYLILNCFKRLIALWLSEDIKDSERKIYFYEIMEELKSEPLSEVSASINRIMTKYRALYDLNPEFLREIKQITDAHSHTPSTPRHSYSSSSSSSSDSSCFVATAAFGTPWAHEIDILRRWRDEVLTKNIFGMLFIKFYYAVGPYLARIVDKSDILKKIVRKIIYYIIRNIKF